MTRALRSPAGGVIAAAIVTIGLAGCSSGGGGDPQAFCTHYKAAASHGASLSNVDAISVDTFQQQIRSTAEEASAAADAAPGDIAKPARRLAEQLDELRKASDAAGDRTDLEAAIKQYVSASGNQRADSDALAAWAASNCAVVTVVPTSTSTTVPTSALGG